MRALVRERRAPGRRRRKGCSDAAERRRCPPAEGAALGCSSFFSPGSNFAIYAIRLEKACLLSGGDKRWRTKAVGSHGLAKGGNKSFCPRPAITKQQPIQIVLTKGWGDQFLLIAGITWTFLLSNSSECLPLTMQRTGGDLLSESCLEKRRRLG